MHFSGKLHACFTALAHEQPSAPALITDDSVLTYAELDAAADTLARELHTRGMDAREAIGVLTERSAGLPAAFLAILKAGGVYVPMVADLPADRLANMARQAGIRRLIALDGLEPPPTLMDTLIANGAAVSGAVIRPEALSADLRGRPPLPGQPGAMTDLAAILFTSGSTGMPKGVMIQHDACAHMALGHIKVHGIHPGDRVLLSASPGFILGFRELCLPLMSGAAFVPVSRSLLDDPDRLVALMGRHRVSIALFTPSYLRLLNGAVPEGLRCIVTAGERPNADDARHYARHVEYWNVHGATEVCGTICMHRVNPDDEGTIPSGRPFVDTAVYLLDEDGNEVEQGEIGELHIVGIGVSRGYLNQPELTAGSFVETRYGRAFRTRDLARWNTNGELETLGRADDVVKVSGQAVSLSEIERTLQRHPAVRRAAALQFRGRLVACVECPDPDQAREVNWREFVGTTLPAYMIPAQVAALARMPISSAGKVDRRALQEIAAGIFDDARESKVGTAPQSDLEQAIAAIWEDLLGHRPIMREDNFFAVGGTSLLAIAVSQRLQNLGHRVPVQAVLASLTVEALAGRIALDSRQAAHDADAVPMENLATADQRDFWIAAEIGLAPAASHIVRIMGIRGANPSPEAWQRAWSRVLERHPALRTAFFADAGGRLRWRTVAMGDLDPPASLAIERCASLSDARDRVAHRAREPFQLTEPPLVRAGLITVAEGNEPLFWMVLHHAVVDGVSAGLIQEELLALLAGRPLPPAPDGIALASHAQQRYLASEQAGRDREFWHHRLDGLVRRGGEAFLDAATERSRPVAAGGQAAPPLAERLAHETVESLGRLAKAHGAGLHALLLALLAAEIRRRRGDRDLMVGSGISVRPAGGDAGVGHFVNVLPVIFERHAGDSFAASLRAAQHALTETVAHAAWPAGDLYREFRHRHPDQRPAARTSLFDIALTAILPRTSIDRESGLTLTPRCIPGELEYPPAGLDLSFSHEPCPEEEGGGVNLLLVWNPDVCTEHTATAWLSSLAAWARWLAEAPERAAMPLPPLLPHEAALLERWEQGAEEVRPQRRSHELFEQAADRHPHRPAVVGHDQCETFSQLDARANGIAHELLRRGLTPGGTIAVLTTGSADLPATVLGIWKAGGVYLPLAAELPAPRLADMARDGDAAYLAVLDRLAVPQPLADAVSAIIRPEECAPSDQRPQVAGSPEDCAYIIYTSGTTGVPKGIPVTHAAYVNSVLGVAQRVGLRPDDRMSLAATVGFDASLWELGHGLMTGIALVPVSSALRDDPWQLKRYYAEQGVTIAFHVTSYLRVSEKVPFEGVRILLTGGEAPNHNDVRHHAGYLEFWNFYGPTEAAIVVSGERIMGDHDPDAPLPVGRPLPNTVISLRRPDGTPVPPGEQGELWLGGVGITPGYQNRPELDAESFVTTSEGRFYRSGDYGCWTADGLIVLSGRRDDQVKLNGQRVELGEIEQALRSHPAVAHAAVLVDSVVEGAKVVRAFVCPGAGDSATEAALMEFLSERLPVHMLPAGITAVPAIPLAPNGKIDRGALLDRARQEAVATVKEAPQDPLEARIAALWAEILGVPAAAGDNFFALGGNSLLAVALAHRVSESLGVKVAARALFAAPVLAGFARSISRVSSGDDAADVLSETDLATEGEREFWVAEAAGLDTSTFTIPLHRRVPAHVTAERIQGAWSMLVKRHEGLRTFFEEDGHGRLLRRIMPEPELPPETAVVPDHAAALAHIRQRQAEPLPMNKAPLWRMGLVDVEEDGTRWLWLALHHAIGDGHSLGVLLNELAALLSGGSLPSPCPGGRIFAAREQGYLAGGDAAADAAYWRELLLALPDGTFDEWPLDTPRSAAIPPGNHRFEAYLDPGTAVGLQAMARSCQATLHAVMLTLLAMDLRRRTGRTTLLIGTAASIRETADDAAVVGYCVNMLPLPLSAAGGRSFRELLGATRDGLALALHHSRYPFARIYRAFWNERPTVRNPQRYPLFDVTVTENPGGVRGAAAELFQPVTPSRESIGYELTGSSPGQDLVLMHEVTGDGGILVQWHVNAAVYSRETGVNLLESLVAWAHWLAADPSRASRPLPGLLPGEEELLARWEQGDTVNRPPLRFHELFEAVVDRPGQGDLPAVITASAAVSYRELDEAANAVAHALLERHLKQGDVVGVLTARSPWLPAAVLGIWKAGGVYLPLAVDLPPERLGFMARDAGVAHLIALDGAAVPAGLADTLPAVLRPEEVPDRFRHTHGHRPAVAGSCRDLAYILYTSGSTGQPKGTLVGHDSYVNLVLGVTELLGLVPHDRCLMFASPSFDVSLSDIGVPLACGAAICPASSDIIESPRRFLAFLEAQRITVADITPTYLRLFDGAGLPPALHTLITGGEPPLAADVAAYGAKVRYYNAYGPTENTITSSMGLVTGDGRGLFPAGRPLPNTSIHICDASGDPVAPGAVGEICLGGAGLSRGYLNRPELTQACFVATPAGVRYRSGDLGRWRGDGTLEVLGRRDEQVKLNGIRIELGEIEHVLACHPSVRQAAVLPVERDAGTRSLWGVVCPVAGEESALAGTWRSFLAERLPAVMIPAEIVQVPALPLTPSGKVDRSALLALCAHQGPSPGATPPRDDLERAIAGVWCAVLGRATVFCEDNFFALGGHSLLAIAVAHRLEQTLGRPVPARELFAEPTLAGFARRLRTAPTAATGGPDPSDRATEGQREFWTAQQAGHDTGRFNIPLTLAVGGNVPEQGCWQGAWQALAARHDSLRTGFYEDEAGELRRRVAAHAGADLEWLVVRRRDEALAHIRARQTTLFDMGTPALWRAGLVRIADGETLFWLVLHHSIGDGLSLGILMDELAALLRGEALAPSAGGLDLASGEERAYLESSAARDDAAYWQGTLAHLMAKAPEAFEEWPLDKPRSRAHTVASSKGGHCHRSRLDRATLDGLRRLAQRNGASLHALMLTILGHEVRRRTGRQAFLLGTAASTRQSASEAGVVGYFVNMLPLVCRADAAEPFESALHGMQRGLAKALRHSRYPFARIYGDFRQEHPQAMHPGRYPLFDIAVTENPGGAGAGGDGLRFNGIGLPECGTISYEVRQSVPAQDMVLIHEAQPDGSLVLTWFANAALYGRDTAHAWFEALLGWMRFLAVGNRHDALPPLLPAEERRLAQWQNGPTLPLPAPSLPALFSRLAGTHPDRPALVTDTEVVTYREMAARTDRLASALRSRGLERGGTVGVYTERSAALPETVLAIWKAGGCYLPLTADLPGERLAFMAGDAGVRILVALDRLTPPDRLAGDGRLLLRPEDIPDERLGCGDDPHPHSGPLPEGEGTSLPGGIPVSPDDSAYIIYTSGSTGLPKGVVLRHGGLLNLGVGVAHALDFTANDRALLISSPSFDAWISDLAMAWTTGAAVVPVRREQMNDIPGMRGLFRRLGITAATMSPSYLRLFEHGDLAGLRILMTVGEQPIPDDARHYAARLAYYNGYGPTENTAATAIGRISSEAEVFAVGRPLANTSVHILDDQGNPVPPGVAGQIWVAGAGLAAGYLNRPDLTAASFVTVLGEQRYRTGDLGRWLPSGELQVLGREDSQVKLRGQRVELGEIEHRLMAWPGVRQAVALVETHEDRTQTLRAFVALDPEAVEPAQVEWSAHLEATLPSYMIPASIVRVDAIPVTVAGKVDHRALLALTAPGAPDRSAAGMPPLDGAESAIAAVWSDILACPVGRGDTFFDLGGDSLRAIAVIGRLRRDFECQVNDLYEHPVLADFARVCRQRPEQLRGVLGELRAGWKRGGAPSEAARDAALRDRRAEYAARIDAEAGRDLISRRSYRHVLLTGAAGYLGSHLLAQLLSGQDRQVTAVVRASDGRSARERLGRVLIHYFGEARGTALRDDRCLTVLAGDLRHADLGLSGHDFGEMAATVDAVYHCAANVNHFGHYRDFHLDNVAATHNLLSLASRRRPEPADFHFISTLSVAGRSPSDGFRLFTEYDPVPAEQDGNYYIRSKQEGERLVLAARGELANASIYRVGNVVFATDGVRLQRNLADNAFFRQLSAFLRLGVVPRELHVSLCHADVAARAIVALSDAGAFANETHHVEKARLDLLADFIRTAAGMAERVRACDFGGLLERLHAAIDEPGMERAVAETVETFGIRAGHSPLDRLYRLAIASDRTQALLDRLGVTWPAIPPAGQHAMMQAALEAGNI